MGESERVLYVDDDAEYAALTAEFLERASDRLGVLTAASVDEATERLDETAFDCVVSDYDMPGMDGLELLERVRERDDDLPFILFTGRGSETIASDAIARGVTDYLRKRPGTEAFELLANRVEHAIEQYRATERAERFDRLCRLVRKSNQVLVLYDFPDGKNTDNRMLMLYSIGLSEEEARPTGIIDFDVDNVEISS